MSIPEMGSHLVDEVLHIPRSPQTLFPDREAAVAEIDSLVFRIEHGVNIWVKEAATFRRDPLEILHGIYGRDESAFHHALEGIAFLGMMDIGDRAANGLRLEIERVASVNGVINDFGDVLRRATNDPLFSDHNHPHFRRYERWVEAIVMNIGNLRHSESISEWVDSLMLQPYFHDIDQTLSLQRNFDENRGIGENQPPELAVKKGHAVAGAVMILALHKLYAKNRIQHTGDAWKVAAGAAYMMLKHDEPENLMAALSRTFVDNDGVEKPKIKAYSFIDNQRILMHGSQLLQLFNDNKLDLTTLSPSQLVEILKMIKAESGFFADGRSIYGLHPEFEKLFGDQLRDLENNHDPIFYRLDEAEVTALNLATEVAIRADMMDMIAPPTEAIYRTLMTQYSQQRPFWRDNIPLQILAEQISAGSGNITSETDSDVRRLLWEFMNIEHVSPDSVLARSRYINKVNRDNSILGILVLKQIGQKFITGDFSPVSDSYKQRISGLTDKALNKAGISYLTQLWLQRQFRAHRNPILISDYIERQGYIELSQSYLANVTHLLEEEQALIGSLNAKYAEFTGVDFDPVHQATLFIITCDQVIDQLCDKYHVSRKKLNRYKKKIATGKTWQSLPYRAYDSLGNPEQIRTIIPPRTGAEIII